jgi:H+/gluconate symporter-like permease
MATITAAVLLIGGLIAIIIMIIAVIYPEWFTRENKSMARVTTEYLRNKKDKRDTTDN